MTTGRSPRSEELHDEPDAAVFDAHGWPHCLADDEVLAWLVALAVERAAEEARGTIRWPRPGVQNPAGVEAPKPLGLAAVGAKKGHDKAEVLPDWSRALPDRFAAVRDLLQQAATARASFLKDVAGSFKRAKLDDVTVVLQSFAALGLVVAHEALRIGHSGGWRRG